jgi:type II secretory pathway pseudopilin PulG
MVKKKGFSLIETVIAIALVGMVIVTILLVFTRGNDAIKKSRSIIMATTMAEKKISEVRNLMAKYPKYGEIIDETEFRESISDMYTIDPNSIAIWNGIEATGTSLPMSPDTITITGTENTGLGIYEFEIIIIDYTEPVEGLQPDIKDVSVEITWTDPPSTLLKKLKMKTLIAKK